MEFRRVLFRSAKREPFLTFFVEDQVGIDGVEIVFQPRSQNQPAIDPTKISSRWIQRFISKQGNSRRILAEHRKRVVKMILTVEEGDIRRLQFIGLRALLLDPFRNLSEDVPALLPLMQVLGATDGNLPFSDRKSTR